MIEEVRFALDSPLEEERFEPSVPPKRDDDAVRLLEGKMPEISNGDFEKRYLLRGNRETPLPPPSVFTK